ncbi:hypothetical protein ENBRE01_2502 [Enteropsectra breve]|nr:hypothetical protein ENBRE01_2502 [Enteropsectra breve]
MKEDISKLITCPMREILLKAVGSYISLYGQALVGNACLGMLAFFLMFVGTMGIRNKRVSSAMLLALLVPSLFDSIKVSYGVLEEGALGERNSLLRKAFEAALMLEQHVTLTVIGVFVAALAIGTIVPATKYFLYLFLGYGYYRDFFYMHSANAPEDVQAFTAVLSTLPVVIAFVFSETVNNFVSSVIYAVSFCWGMLNLISLGTKFSSFVTNTEMLENFFEFTLFSKSDPALWFIMAVGASIFLQYTAKTTITVTKIKRVKTVDSRAQKRNTPAPIF